MTDKGAVVALGENIEGFCPARQLVKEDGTTPKAGDKLDFKVLEFSKATKRITLSHAAYVRGGEACRSCCREGREACCCRRDQVDREEDQRFGREDDARRHRRTGRSEERHGGCRGQVGQEGCRQERGRRVISAEKRTGGGGDAPPYPITGRPHRKLCGRLFFVPGRRRAAGGGGCLRGGLFMGWSVCGTVCGIVYGADSLRLRNLFKDEVRAGTGEPDRETGKQGIGNRESGIGNRESGIGNRESGIGNRGRKSGRSVVG